MGLGTLGSFWQKRSQQTSTEGVLKIRTLDFSKYGSKQRKNREAVLDLPSLSTDSFQHPQLTLWISGSLFI
ncbi:hypothetical protein CapIbe_010080 [Capra ibex]